MAAVAVAVLHAAVGAPRGVAFGSLSKVGETWYGGTWGKLDSKGVQTPGTCGDKGSPPCHRGEPGVSMLSCPGSSPRLMVLGPTAVVAMGNESAQTSTDGGRSWHRYAGPNCEGRTDIYDPYIPSPAWLSPSGFMDIRPVPAYVTTCATPANCTPASSVVAPADKVYLDWKLSSDGLPVINRTVGRSQPNIWGGLPGTVSMFNTEGGGGAQLADGSFVYLAAVQHTDPRADPHDCCNNSVWAFTSPDGLSWTYASPVAEMGTTREYQEGFSESSVVLLKDKKTLWAVIRTDSCDGDPSHRTLPFLSATSTNGGRSWSPATALPDDMLSSTPKATVLTGNVSR